MRQKDLENRDRIWWSYINCNTLQHTPYIMLFISYVGSLTNVRREKNASLEYSQKDNCMYAVIMQGTFWVQLNLKIGICSWMIIMILYAVFKDLHIRKAAPILGQKAYIIHMYIYLILYIENFLFDNTHRTCNTFMYKLYSIFFYWTHIGTCFRGCSCSEKKFYTSDRS